MQLPHHYYPSAAASCALSTNSACAYVTMIASTDCSRSSQRVFYIMTGVDHPAETGRMVHAFGIHAFDQFIKDEKELVRFYTANGKVIIAIL